LIRVNIIGGNRVKACEQQAAHRNDQPVLRCVARDTRGPPLRYAPGLPQLR
jgi:hypothetical protein